MAQNNSSQLPKYEDLFNKLENSLNEYLKIRNGKNIKNFNLSQKATNDDGFENRLIETGLKPSELLAEIKESYLRRDYIEGEIGTIDGAEQYDGIFNMALYMLMSNRLAKHYIHEVEKNSNLNNTTKKIYEQKIKQFMSAKKDALTQLIYSLYIYKETENDNDFFYGHRLDNNNTDTFVIDLPAYGQISVHFGSESNLERVEHLAKQNIDLILKRKLQLNQITQNKYNQIKHKLKNNEVLPEYTGKLYEHSSAIPLDYQGKNFIRAQKDLHLSKKMITDYTKTDIERISRNKKYNSRELYYWAIRSDFSKEQLEQLSNFLQERDSLALSNPSVRNSVRHQEDSIASDEAIAKFINAKSMGRKVVASTTAEERKVVAQHENSRKIYIVDRRKEIKKDNGENIH